MTKTNHALVTGATSGIGYAIARRLVDRGYRVSVNGILNEGTIEDFLLSFGDRERVRFAQADLRDSTAIASMIEQSKEAFGPVSVLINNASVRSLGPVEEFSPDMWDAILAVNLSSAFHTIRLLASDMKDLGWGRIINLASALSLVGSPYQTACLLYTSPSPRDRQKSRMPSSA